MVAAVYRAAATCTPGRPAALAAVHFATPLVDTFVAWLGKLVAVPAPVPSFVYPAHNGFMLCGAGDCLLCPTIAAFLVSAAPTLSLTITKGSQYQHVERRLRSGVDVDIAVRVPHSKITLLTKRNSHNAVALALQPRERLTTAELLSGLTQVPIGGSTMVATPLSPGASLKATLARLLADPSAAGPTPSAAGSRSLATAGPAVTGSTAAVFVRASLRSPYASVAAAASSRTPFAPVPDAAAGAAVSAYVRLYADEPSPLTSGSG